MFRCLKVISLVFIDVDIVQSDLVRIYDGYNETAPILVTFPTTTGIAVGQRILTTQRYMFISFTSDSSLVKRGFKATFLTVSEGNFI